MKINELLKENVDDLRNAEVANIAGASLTAGQIADAVPGADPNEVIQNAKTIQNFLQKKLVKDYTVSNALIDVATFYPAIKLGKLAVGGVAGAKALATKELPKAAVRREIGKEIQRNVDILPDVEKSSKSPEPSAASMAPLTKKRKYKIGDMVPVTINGKPGKGIVTNVLARGYEVDVSNIKQAPSKKISIPEPLAETATAGSTSAGNIASTGNSPHIAAGSPAVLKRWSGSPGKIGKSIKPTQTKSQTADDNPVTNPKVGGNLIS
jgi:hypothetical protein